MTGGATKKKSFRRGDRTIEASLRETSPGHYVLAADGVECELEIERVSPGVFRIVRDGRASVVTTAKSDRGASSWLHANGTTISLEEVRADGARKAKRHHTSGDLLAPMPAKVVRVEVAVGATVRAGDTLLVLEAMKMEHSLRAPTAGVVRAINAAAGEMVAMGQLLAEVEAATPSAG